MSLLVLSDIHSNSWSFRKIVDQYKDFADVKFCILGDAIGYGPDPVGCLKIIMELDERGKIYRDSSNRRALIGGNHEEIWLWCEEHCSSLVDDLCSLLPPERYGRVVSEVHRVIASQFNQSARGYTIQDTALIAILLNMTTMRLNPHPAVAWYRSAIRENWCGPIRLDIPGRTLILAHGSSDKPCHRYLFPCDVEYPGELEEYMQKHYGGDGRIILLHGHTHVPLYLSSGPTFQPDFDYNKEIEDDADTIVINPGSIGLPRDLDLRPSAMLLNYDHNHITIKFIREELSEELREQYLQKLHAEYYPPVIENWFRLASMTGRLRNGSRCRETIKKMRKRSNFHWKGN